MHFCFFTIISPWERAWSFISPLPIKFNWKWKMMLYAKFGWNWSSGSVEDHYVKGLQIKGQPDRQTTDNCFQSNYFDKMLTGKCLRRWTALPRLNHTAREFLRVCFLRNFENLLKNMKIERYLENNHYIYRLDTFCQTLWQNTCHRQFVLPSNQVNDWYCYMVLLWIFSYIILNL